VSFPEMCRQIVLCDCRTHWHL